MPPFPSSRQVWDNPWTPTIEDNAKGVAADLETHPADLELVDGAATPLFLAANQCSTNVLGLLLKKGARKTPWLQAVPPPFTWLRKQVVPRRC